MTTTMGTEDLYLLLEVIAVDNANQALRVKHAQQQRNRG